MPENEKSQSLEIVAPSALEALERAEVDIAISTAKKYPRDTAQSLKKCRELALRDPETASSCNYVVPRGGKKIVGPSVHFAEIVLYAWGNCQVLSRVIGADRENVHIQGVCHDLETNNRVGEEMDWPVQPPHDNTPERWKDQINLAKRAGAAVARRNAIFRVIPQAFFKGVAEEAKRVAVGEGKTFIESRNNAITALKAMGISQEMIYRALHVGGLESISTDDLIWLHASMTSIKEGTMTVAEVFGNSMDPVKAQVPSRPRGRPPKEEPIEVKAEQIEAKREPPSQPQATPQPAAEAPSPPASPVQEPKTAESLDPFPEPKPAPAIRERKWKAVPTDDLIAAGEKETPPKAAAPASSPTESSADKIRAKALEAGLSEEDVIAWLDDLGTVPDETKSLDTVNPKWVKMVLDDWDGIIDQVRELKLKLALKPQS